MDWINIKDSNPDFNKRVFIEVCGLDTFLSGKYIGFKNGVHLFLTQQCGIVDNVIKWCYF